MISQKKFAIAALNPDKEVLVIYMAHLRVTILNYLAWIAQIALLMAKKVNISVEYLDFANILLKKLAPELFKCFDINKYLIDLQLGKQPSYGLIYNLESIELEILKI